MQSKSKLERELLDLLASFYPAIVIKNNAYHLSVELSEKKVNVVLPYPLHEVYFDFWETGSNIYSESFELYNNESDKELIAYLCSTLSHFLNNSTRVHVRGKLFKVKELQYQQDTSWKSVF